MPAYCEYIYTYVGMHACMPMYIHTLHYIHTHIHIHTEHIEHIELNEFNSYIVLHRYIHAYTDTYYAFYAFYAWWVIIVVHTCMHS
jgi:hypothetical protein